MTANVIKCPNCRGTGLDDLSNYPCKKCLGYGEVIEFGQNNPEKGDEDVKQLLQKTL